MPREPVLLEPTSPCPILPGDLILDARSDGVTSYPWFEDRPKGGVVISSASPRVGGLTFKMLTQDRSGQLRVDERKFNVPSMSTSPSVNAVRITLVRAHRRHEITILLDFERFSNYFYYDVSDEQEVTSGVNIS